MKQLLTSERGLRMCAGLALLALVAVTSSAVFAASTNRAATLNVLDSNPDRIVIQYKLADFTQKQININGQNFAEIHLGKEALRKEKGAPALPDVSRSIIIPDDARMTISVVNSSYYDVQNIYIPPSKGNLLRNVNPADVPYTFSSAYQKNAFYPGALASLREPYIMRDHRGITVTINPFQYNPVQRVLRVYTDMTIQVTNAGKDSQNVLQQSSRKPKKSRAFRDVYSSQFINYSSSVEALAASLDTQGDMLIIAYDPWISNLQPLADHKNSIGINTTIVGVSTIGNDSTSIKNYIQNVYNTSDLAYVLLVGDATQVATPTASGGSSDPSYSKLAGSDNYPDVFVGRFSAESDADVDTQVLKTIEYENMPATQQDWFWRGVGIASPEGDSTTGDDAQSDQQHIEGLRLQLLSYNYTLVNQIYEAAGPTKADISNALNAGRGIINYCGHGSTTAWGTTGFSVTEVMALTNANMLPFIFDVACVNGQFNGYTCFAEAWMRATNGGEPTGAVGIYASSINQSWAPPMEAQDAFTTQYIAGTYSTYGALCYAASCSMMDKYGTGGVDMFNTWHIFGDPSLRIVGAVASDANIAGKPTPADKATGMDTNTDISWTPGAYAGSHDVYFGTDYNAVANADYSSAEFKGNQPIDANSYDPGTLAYNTTYYWSIDEVNETSIWPGNIWSFTTIPLPPAPAANPSPANEATNVGLTTDFSWTAGNGATSHDVYFGTVNPPPFVVNQTATTYGTGTMTSNTTYYWRIDEKNVGGTTSGTVWSFITTTAAPPPTFVAAGSVASGTGTITPALPSGIASGDILLLFLETSNQTISISNSNGGTWTAVTNSPQSTGTAAGTTGVRLTAFWSRYNGTQGAPTASDSGNHQLGRIIAIRGAVSSGNPWDVTAGGVEASSDISGSIPGATTTVDNTLVVAAIATALPDSSTTTNFSSWTNSNLTEITERTDNAVTAGNGGGLGIVTGTNAAAGAYGNTTVTCASSSYKAMMSIAIKPETVSTTPPGQAENPTPADSATNISVTTDLSWTAGNDAKSHDVYFGTVNPPPFVVNQTTTTYDTGTMATNTTYYWRIDEKNTIGTTTGAVWSFTTTTVVPAPTFVAAGTVASGTSAITPTLPSGIATGDILLLFLETSNQAISISNSNGGTWTAVTNSPQSTGTAASSTGARLTAFWSRYNGTQGAPTTSDSGDHQLGRIIAIRGAAASGNPWDVTAGGVEAVSDKSGSIAGATTTVANTLVVTAIATALPDATGTSNFASWTNSNLTGITERIDNTVTAGNGGGIGIATSTKATTGAYGNTAVTCASSSYKAMMSIAIKP